MALKDLKYNEGAMALIGSMGQLTVLRTALQEPPFQALYTLLGQLLGGEAVCAYDTYHSLTHTLLTDGYRRSSGDMFRDFLYYILLERENRFSALAAQSYWDEPLCAAMRLDLEHLSLFFELNSMTLKRWIGECHRETRQRPRQQKDNIAVISSAVWGGATVRPLPPVEKPMEPLNGAQTFIRNMNEGELPSWRYQHDALQETHQFVADSALEELYHRLDVAEDKGTLLDDIWSFHAAYGTGAFLRDRLFLLQGDGTLQPIPQELLPTEDAYTFYQAQRDRGLKNAIRFMRGEPAQNMFLSGGPGTGKTTQVFSLCRELPELRLISCGPAAYEALIRLLPGLCKQPLRFALFFDDFNSAAPFWPAVKAALAPAGIQPANILAIAAAQKADASFFPLQVQLPPPQLKEFIELVQMLLLREGRDVDFDCIQNACIDYAAYVGGADASASPLSFRSAEIIAETLNNDLP